MLYVGRVDTAAVALYRRFGFESFQADIAYQRG